MVVIGTRPEAIKMAPVILAMQRDAQGLTPVVCVTGQHRQLLDPVLQWFKIECDYDLNLMQPNQGVAAFAGRALIHMNGLLGQLKPDAVLVQGDTTTAMVGALAAFYHAIPVGHVEAGLRTHDLANPFPEEMNRRVAGMVAQFHFAPTERAAQALRQEKVNPGSIHIVGNTFVDALRITMARLPKARFPLPAAAKRIVLVTAHRRENFGPRLRSICRAIRTLANRNEDCTFIYSLHLNPNVRNAVENDLRDHPRIQLIEPLRYEEFVRLISRSDLILTDSGGVQEEATALGKRTLVLRNTTERPEAVSSGLAQVVGTETDEIVVAAQRALQAKPASKRILARACPFGDGFAAERIVQILSSALVEKEQRAVA